MFIRTQFQSILSMVPNQSFIPFCSKVLFILTAVVNTLFLPVKKPGNSIFQFVQDLCAVNAVLLSTLPAVLNSVNVFACIPATAIYFTVVNLYSIFFSIPLQLDSIFSLSFRTKRIKNMGLAERTLLVPLCSYHDHPSSRKKWTPKCVYTPQL